ncbi:hypothetical protein AB0G74_19415 [Streptomyces sp. NPDC020875]|uniref:hypothetical protein n=1 Tax=Streptomyces sp. NPDC020875 TaxID=3154898 RepID=UPI0033EA57B8
MAERKARWGWGALALCGILVAGCTGGGDGDESGKRPSDAAVVVAPDRDVEPAPTLEPADPAALPRTAAEARKMIDKLIVGPEGLPAGTRKATPYESDTATWSVLRSDCVWNREPIPDDVLATLTRHFELPPTDGKGRVRFSATITFHRTAADAAWEQARVVEESLHCDEQVLRRGERLTGLNPQPARFGEAANLHSEDALTEAGMCVSERHGGPYPYTWQQVTYGSMVLSSSVCAGAGYTDEAAFKLVSEVVPYTQLRAREEFGREPGPKNGSKATASPSAPKDGA